MTTHLVLGSEGQIGKYVCDEIERHGDEVIRWDMSISGSMNLHTDAIKSEYTQDAFRAADFVHFLAYDVGGSTYLAKHQNAYQYIDNNIRIMDNVFGALRKHEKPFYFASSQMSNMTDSVYGQLKAVGESYTNALGGINVRFWNVYGYETDLEKSHVITDFIRMALKDGRILCRTDGEERRHFSHAEDVSRLLYRLSKPSVYNGFKEEMPGVALPLVSQRGHGWISIWQIAQLIANHIPGTELYFGRSKDTTQTIHNDIPLDDHSTMLRIMFEGPVPQDFYGINTGILNMINQIKEKG